MNERILKVKVTKDDTIHIAFRRQNRDGVWDDYTLTCHDRATPDFYAAISGLCEHVLEMCELPPDWNTGLEVHGVTFSYSGDNDVMGATITATKRLLRSAAPLVINTPHKASAPYTADGDTSTCLSSGCITALTTLTEEAIAYIDGERAQGDLFKQAA